MNELADRGYAKVVETDRYIIGYYPGEPWMADFHRQPYNPRVVPPLVSVWYCSLCGGDNDALDCQHIQLLRSNAPVEAMIEDDMDAEADWYEAMGHRYAAQNGTL